MDIMRSSSFRMPARVPKKMKHTPSMVTALPKPNVGTTPMLMRSQAWRGSVGK